MIGRLVHVLALAMLAVATFAPLQVFAQPAPPNEALVDELVGMLTHVGDRSIQKEKTLPVTDGKVRSAALDRQGKYLATFDDRSKLAVWNCESGERLFELEPSGAPESGVVAIIGRGPMVAFGSSDGKVEIYDGGKGGKLVNTFDQLTAPVTGIGISERGGLDRSRFFAFDEHGAAIVGLLLSQEVETIPAAFEGDVKPKTMMALGGSKCWWRISLLNDEVKNTRFDGTAILTDGPQYKALAKMRGDDGDLQSYANFEYATKNAYYCVEFNGRKNSYTEHIFGAMGEIIAMERNPRELEGWLVTNHSVQIYDLQVPKNPALSLSLPPDMNRERILLAPMGNTFVSFDQGAAIVWKVVGKRAAHAYEVQAEINRLLDKEEIATLDLLADKVNGEIRFHDDVEHETPYSSLLRRFSAYPNVKTEPEQRIEKFAALQQKYPDSQLLRIALFYLYSLPDQPGDAKASSRQITKGWAYVKPLLELEKPPAEAFVCAFIAGRSLDLDRKDLGEYLRRSFDQYPTYHRIYSEAAYSLLPRFGGKPEAAEALAAKVSDAIGGDEGDVMYTRIACFISHRNSGDFFLMRDLKFDGKRMKRGYLLLAARADHYILLNKALRFAGITRDKAMAEKIGKRFDDIDRFPVKGLVWPNLFPVVDEAIQPLVERLNNG